MPSKQQKPYTPSKIEKIRRDRIRLSVFAYVYEFWNESWVSDGEYDSLAVKVSLDRAESTEYPVMDDFFKGDDYQEHTGSWVHNHPELNKLEQLCRRLKT